MTDRGPRISRRRALSVLGSTAVAAGTVPILIHGAPAARPSVVGHRGAAGLEPPNTIAAIRRAIDVGADGVELDVRRTADGTPVLFHDPILDVSTDGSGFVHETTDEELRSVRVHGEPIPTLAEGLAVLARTDIDVYLEIKRPGYTDAVVDAVEDAGLAHRTTLVSLRRPVLDATGDWRGRVGMVGSVPTPELFDDAAGVDASVVLSHYVPHGLEWFVAEAADRGFDVGVWSLLDTEDTIRDALSFELDVLATNRPDVALEALDR